MGDVWSEMRLLSVRIMLIRDARLTPAGASLGIKRTQPTSRPPASQSVSPRRRLSPSPGQSMSARSSRRRYRAGDGPASSSAPDVTCRRHAGHTFLTSPADPVTRHWLSIARRPATVRPTPASVKAESSGPVPAGDLKNMVISMGIRVFHF